jgi:hypothetical protein
MRISSKEMVFFSPFFFFWQTRSARQLSASTLTTFADGTHWSHVLDPPSHVAIAWPINKLASDLSFD